MKDREKRIEACVETLERGHRLNLMGADKEFIEEVKQRARKLLGANVHISKMGSWHTIRVIEDETRA